MKRTFLSSLSLILSMLIMILSAAAAAGAAAAAAGTWEKVRDLRMPGELRVVNEGVAHDETHWYFSNQHFLYQTEIEPLNITMGIIASFFHLSLSSQSDMLE